MDFRIRENDGRGSFTSFPFLFRVNPWQMLLFAGQITKNLYRKDAKTAKKQQTSSDFLSSFALFASSR
jgi:hypothetical protein